MSVYVKAIAIVGAYWTARFALDYFAYFHYGGNATERTVCDTVRWCLTVGLSVALGGYIFHFGAKDPTRSFGEAVGGLVIGSVVGAIVGHWAHYAVPAISALVVLRAVFVHIREQNKNDA